MMQRLERFWRQCGTGISFALFGLGGLLLALFVFPFINLALRDKARRARTAQGVVHRTWKIYMRIVVAMRVLDFDADGAAVLRGASGTLVIANHPSLLDIVLIMSLMERTQCVVKAGAWKNPFMRGVIKATNYIPNLGDPERVIDGCVAALKSGNNLVIFPEGSRTIPGRKARLQRGFANIARARPLCCARARSGINVRPAGRATTCGSAIWWTPNDLPSPRSRPGRHGA
jgi:1-acyl-sn-glycerol-3-phosphate acyltransferase